MKKIVFILPVLAAGGAERVVVTLMNNLDRSKYEPHMIALQDGPVRGWIADDIPIHILDKSRASTGSWAFFKKLRALEPDIVMSSIVHMNLLTLMCKKFMPRTKFIVRESSLPTAMMKAYGWKSRLCGLVYRFLYPSADLVVCPSRQIMGEFRDVVGITVENHQVLYNPVSAERVLSNVPDAFDGDDEAVVRFVSVGRLTFEKAYDVLIERFAGFEMSAPWRLDIIGEGEERPKLEALIAQHDLGAHVFLQGHQENPWKTVAQADAFLLTSLWEGMPNAALEALLCGTAVIGVRSAGGIVEIAEAADEGAVQLVGDVDAAVGAMCDVKVGRKTSPAASLLPDQFVLETVCARFDEMVQAL